MSVSKTKWPRIKIKEAEPLSFFIQLPNPINIANCDPC